MSETHKIEDLEFATDFDDLNLEIVSNSNPAPRAVHAETESPSIDDFTFVEEKTPARPVKKNRDEWFTKVLGQELGPFPFEKLIQLVSDREIGRHEQIRHGAHGEWITAGEIEGLFPDEEEEDDDFELDVPLQAQAPAISPQAPPSSHGFRAVGGEINRAQANRPPSSNPNAPVIPPASAEPADAGSANPKRADAAEPVAPKPAKKKLTRAEAEELRKQKIAERLNSWLSEKVPTPDEPEEAEMPDVPEPAAAAPRSDWNAPPAAASSYGVTPYAANPAAGYPIPGAAAKPTFSPPKTKSSSGGGFLSSLGGLFGGMSKPDISIDPKAVGALGAILIVFALMYLPSFMGGTNDMGIYNRFREIYALVEQSRSNPGQTLQSAELVAEVEATVDALEKAGAGSEKPAKRELFFAGKYCLVKLLQSPSAEPSGLDDRFQTHMNLAGRILGDPSVPPPPPPPPPSAEEDEFVD